MASFIKSPPQSGLAARICGMVVGAAAAVAALFGGVASAQTAYPARDVNWIVGFPAGSFFDLTTRYFAERFSKEMGRNFTVDLKPGSGSIIGIAAAAQAKPDGYTLLTTADVAWTTFPVVNKDLPYDPEKAFTVIHGMTVTPFFISVPANSPFKTMQELIAHAKENPGKLKFGAVGLGTTAHLAAELMWREAGVKLVNVTYKGGGEMNVDLLGGRLDATIDVPSSALPHIREGKIRSLVALSSSRIPTLPDMPTATEIGYPQVVVQSSMFLAAPAGIPKEAMDKLSAAMKSALDDPATIKFLTDRGLLPLQMTAEEGQKLIDSNKVKMKALIESLGFAAK